MWCVCILPYFDLRVEFFFLKTGDGYPKKPGAFTYVCVFVCLFGRGMSSSLEFNLIYI